MSAFKEGDPTTLNRLYGRSQGKPLRASQQDLVDLAAELGRLVARGEGEGSRRDRSRAGRRQRGETRESPVPDHAFLLHSRLDQIGIAKRLR